RRFHLLATGLNSCEIQGLKAGGVSRLVTVLPLNKSQVLSSGIRGLCKWCVSAGQLWRAIISIRAGRGQRRGLARQERGQAGNSGGEVVQLGSAIPRHRQFWVAVAGQLHRLLEGRARLVEQGDVAVSQGVEVEIERSLGAVHGVGDARGGEVA